MAKTFQCSLVTPKEQLLDEPVTFAALPAWDGEVGVLPGRAPLLVELGAGTLRLEFVEGGARYFFVCGGFAQMKGDKLSILTDEAIPAEQVVKQTAEADLEEARKQKATTEEQVKEKELRTRRARGLIHLHETLGNKV